MAGRARDSDVIWSGSRFTATSVAQSDRKPRWKHNRRGNSAILALIFLVWLIGAPMMLLWAYEPSFSLIGDVPSDAERAMTRTRLGWTCVAAFTASAGALAVAIWQRRAAWVWIFSALTVAVLLFAGAEFVPRDQPTEPLPADYVPCYSGSNDCPGG